MRVLLVICRPRGGEDVPFRSVASRIVDQLGGTAFDIDVLRPPTYERLVWKLLWAKDRGKPYHIVHFDGHGTYANPDPLGQCVVSGLAADPQTIGGRRGFVVFENSDHPSNEALVDGFAVGKLMQDAGVPLLVLNACQSAYAEPPVEPLTRSTAQIREELESYGSFAQAVLHAGAAGVVAMRYVISVTTAAGLVSELYAGLARGLTLGEATSGARRHLAKQPERQVGLGSRPMQDWCVPVVWESEPVRLWPEAPAAQQHSVHGRDKSCHYIDRDLPPPPTVGFEGQDWIFYDLERAFEQSQVVLLHGYAGSGKTAMAAEFARWYAATGGIDGPLLFTSFGRHRPLARVLDKIGDAFPDVRSLSGRCFRAIESEGERQEFALAQLARVPVLWIWDNVEPITGFPTGVLPNWTAEEQQQLRAFLEEARATKAKFLLTSRREERGWLGEMPARTWMLPMPWHERVALAAKIARDSGPQGLRLRDVHELLRFTRGNPLTIRWAIDQALKSGIDTREKLQEYLGKLRTGSGAIGNQPREGLSKSLRASLAYGFEETFNEKDRKILSVLHLFHGFVSAGTLFFMGQLRGDLHVDAISGLSYEHAAELLDRAAALGLLTAPIGFPAFAYAAHPALPWHFRGIFERNFPGDAGERAHGAFAAAMGRMAHEYVSLYLTGQISSPVSLGLIALEEENLLAAYNWALAHPKDPSFHWNVILAMQALQPLYSGRGWRAQWRRLVEETLPHLINPITDEPLKGRDETWAKLTFYRAELAMDQQDWSRAERLYRLAIAREQRRGEAALTEPHTSSRSQYNDIRSQSSLHLNLGRALLEQDDVACLEEFAEALRLSRLLGAHRETSTCMFNLGKAYYRLSAERNLESAERWIREAWDSMDHLDSEGKSACAYQLSSILYERFKQGREAGRPIGTQQKQLQAAFEAAYEALKVIDASNIGSLASTHQILGKIHRAGGNVREALSHYCSSIQMFDEIGDTLASCNTRYDVAAMLFGDNQVHDARDYAHSAVQSLRLLGKVGSDDLSKAEELLQVIEAFVPASTIFASPQSTTRARN